MNKNDLLGITSALSLNPQYSTDYSEFVRNQLQDKANSDWDYASDKYMVLKQSDDRLTWSPIEVRLIFPYELKSSSTIKDDYKSVLFKDLQYPTTLGEMWDYGNYYWMTLDTGRNKSSTSSCMIRRCSDALRWYDENGVYHNLPCIVDRSAIYNLDEERIMALPVNQTRVLVQWNEESELIKWADVDSETDKYTRFILNGYAYRTVSIDRHSYIRNGKGYIDIRLTSDMIKTSDDLVNNIAGAFENNVSVSILNGNSTLQVGNTLQINTVVTKDNVEVVNPTITYTSSLPTIASINSSGLVSGLVASATPTIISASFGGVTSTINLTVTNAISNNYTLDFTASSGNIQTIKLNQTNSYTVSALNNGVVYADTITFNMTDDTGLTPSGAVTIVSTVGNIITLKANNVNANVGQYFRLYAIGTNKTDYIRIQIKSIF